MFNAFADDVAQTFNTAQPVIYGGTGSTTAVGGADALSPAFVNVASAATTNIGAASSPNVNITGTTTITAFDSFGAGAKRLVKFTGILTLTHNATSLILPGAANITTAAGDTALFVSEGGGNWRCIAYTRAVSTPYQALGTVAQSSGIPTGAAMERGSNANGTWSRFADGTQICTHNITVSPVTTAAGALFQSSAVTWTYPQPFLAGSNAAAYGTDRDVSAVWYCTGPYSSVAVDFRAVSFASSASIRAANVVAVGRWF